MDMEVGSEMERGAGKDVGKPFTTFIVNKIQSEPVWLVNLMVTGYTRLAHYAQGVYDLARQSL